MAEFEFEGVSYRTGRLSTVQQWEIFSRLGPMLPAMTAEFNNGASRTLGARWIMGAATGSLSELKQADRDYLFYTCLSVVDRRDPATGSWFKVSVNGRIMYEDIDLSALLEAMDLVVQENLGGFFARLRTASDEATAETPSTTPAELH